jgi:hypothetical protein
MEAAGVLPPGAGEQVGQLIAKGMAPAKALEGKLTGVAGATDAAAVLGDVTKQASIVQEAITDSAQKLKEAGVLTGKESGIQAGGAILAGVTGGAKNVAEMLSSKAVDIGSAVAAGSVSKALGVNVSVADLSSLKDSFTSGKLAAGIGESVSGGLGGLKSSLEGIGDKLKGEVDNMKSGLQNAFASVEKSFPALQGGKVNILGSEGQSPTAKSELETAGSSYDSAKAEYDSAETEWFQAKRDYSYSKSDEDYERITTAEAAMAAAKQKMTKASTAFLKSMPGGSSIASLTDKIGGATAGLGNIASGIESSVTGGLNSLEATAKGALSSIKSGMNALPGGVGSLVSQVNNSGAGTSPLDKLKSMATDSVASLKGTADSISNFTGKLSEAGNKLGNVSLDVNSLSSTVKGKLEGLSSTLGDPTKLAGGALSGMSSKIEGALAGKLGGLTGDPKSATAAAKGMIAQLQASLDAAGGPGAEVKSAVTATGTFDKTALTAKLGKLFGDSKIPVPTFSDNIKPSPEAEQVSKEQEAALEAVKEAEYKVNSAKLNLRLTKSAPFSGQQKEEAVTKATEGLATAQADLDAAQKAYSDIINKQA